MPSAAQITREYILRDRSGDAARSISDNLKRVSQASEGAARSIDRIGQGAQRFGQQAVQGARGAAEAAAAVDNSARAFERLERRYDPVIRAQARYAANLDIIERANDRGSVSTARQVAAIERLAKSQADAATAAKLLADAQGRGLITGSQHQQILAKVTKDFKDAENGAKGAARGIDGIGQSASRVGPMIAKLAAALATGFLARAIIKATSEQEDAIQRLGNAISATGGIAERSVGQLTAFAETLAKTTRYSDEAIEAGQARLLAFTNVRGAAFDRATVNALDLATAKGMELVSAFELIGKVADQPVRAMKALREAGVNLSDAEQRLLENMVKNRDMAGAQGVAFAAIEARYKGAAEAARGTLGGALEGLKNRFGELLELGGPASSTLTENINRLSEALSDPVLKRAIDDILGGIVWAVEKISHGISAIYQGIQNIKTANWFGGPNYNDPTFTMGGGSATAAHQLAEQAAAEKVRKPFGFDTGAEGKKEASAAENARKELKALNDEAQALNRTMGDSRAFKVAQEELKLVASGAYNTGAAAHEMAEKIVTATERVNAAKIEAGLANQQLAIEQLQVALEGGTESFRDWERAQQMAGDGAADTARQYLDLAHATREAEKAQEDIRNAAQAIEDLTVDPFRNFTENARDAVTDFARDFHDKGFKAADDLGAKIKATFKGIVNDFIFKTVFEQPLKALTQALSGGGLGSAPGGGIISNIFGSGGGVSGVDAAGNIVAQESTGLFSIADTLKKMLKPFGDIAATLAKTFGGGSGTQAFASVLGESFAAAVIGNETGNAIGQLLGIQKNATNATVGGGVGAAAGAIAGSFLGNPQLGAAVGSFLGNLVGGLFGPDPTNAAVGAGFNPATGSTFNLFNSNKGNSAANYAALQTAVQNILETTQGLAKLGITFTEQVNAINIGARDPTNIWFNPLGVISPNFTGQKRVDLSTVGDTADLARAVVKELLSTATASDPKIQSIISAGLDAEKTLAILDGFRKIDDVMGSLKAPASAVAQALQTIGETFDPIIADLRSLSTAGAALNAVLQSQAQAVATVREKFISDLKQQQIEALSPTAGQLSTVLKTNAQRLADATLVGGGEATAVAEAVNSIAIKQFAASAVGAAGSIQGLNDAFALLIQNATAAGDSIEPIKNAFRDATAEIVKNVNENTATTLLGLTNPVAAKWEELRKQGRDALADIQTLAASAAAQGLPAVDVQGATTAVALQQSQFLAGLSADDRAKLGLNIDSIVSLTDRMVAILRDLEQAFTDDIAARKDWIDKTREQAADFIAAGQSLSQIVTGQRDQYNPLPAKAQQSDLQARFDTLYTEALAGNLSAVNAIGQVGASILQLARQRGASGEAFQATFKDITGREQVVADAAALAGKTANERANAAEALIALEENIRKAVLGPSPNLAALQEMVAQLGPSGTIATLLSQFISTSAQIQGLPIPSAADVHAQATSLSSTQPATVPTPSVAAIAPVFAEVDAGQSPDDLTQVTPSTPTDPALQNIHKDLVLILAELRAQKEEVMGLRRDLQIDPSLRRAVG